MLLMQCSFFFTSIHAIIQTPVPYEVAVQPMACPKGDSCSDDFGLLTPLGDEFMIVTYVSAVYEVHGSTSVYVGMCSHGFYVSAVV